MNVILQLEFELSYFKAAVQHVCYHAALAITPLLVYLVIYKLSTE